jgi:hypothetical protein
MITNVQKLRQDLANVITSELRNKAMEADLPLQKYVNTYHAGVRGLVPYFCEGSGVDDYLKLRDGDLEVLVEIADTLGFEIDINWYRRGKKS